MSQYNTNNSVSRLLGHPTPYSMAEFQPSNPTIK